MTLKKKALRIAMIGQKDIPSNIGGVEVVVRELSTRFVKLGHNVVCYNRRRNGKKSNSRGAYKGVHTVTVRTIGRGGMSAFTSSFFATIKVLKSNTDVVHYHAEGPCYWLPLVKRFSNKRVVATVHGLDWQRQKWKWYASRLIKKGEKNAVKYADEIIVLSHNNKKYFEDTYNRETIYIPNGIEKHELRPASIIKDKYGLDNNEYILFLGRITPEKGLHYLIDAYNKIKTEKKLVIAGGVEQSTAYYESIREKAKHNSNIIFVGFVDGEEKEELYSNACLYCLPSDIEGMPMSLLEAMSYGNKCVVSNIKENTEVVGDRALVFKRGNSEDLADKLSLIINKKDSLGNREEIAGYITDRFSWDDVVAETLSVYRKNLS